MAQTKTNVLPIGQTFSSPPTMRLFGLFDYGPKFQTEALPSDGVDGPLAASECQTAV